MDWISTFRATRIPPWTRSAGNGADESSRLETTVGPPATTNAPPPADTVKVPFRFSMNARCCPFSSSTRDAAFLPDRTWMMPSLSDQILSDRAPVPAALPRPTATSSPTSSFLVTCPP